MYESFYGLTEKPFTLLPDPEYLYLSPKHQRALTLLQYGMMNQAGFSVICGDTGAGKTTLIRRLLSELEDNTTVGLITNTHQSFGELLNWVLMAFGLDGEGKSKSQMHHIFVNFLVEQYAQNRHTVLIVDEAQNMKADTLEELRMLSNINADKDQVLQVILAGQPALRETLRRPELMQFAQRIAVDYYLEALNEQETHDYIQHRLQVAGAKQTIFTDDACSAIYQYSGGTPRLINLLCDTALVYGYAEQRKTIDAALVHDVVREQHSNSIIPTFKTSQPHATDKLPPVQPETPQQKPAAAEPVQSQVSQGQSDERQPVQKMPEPKVSNDVRAEHQPETKQQARATSDSQQNTEQAAASDNKEKSAKFGGDEPIADLARRAHHAVNEDKPDEKTTEDTPKDTSSDQQHNEFTDTGTNTHYYAAGDTEHPHRHDDAPYRSQHGYRDEHYPIVHIEDNPRKGLNLVLIGLVIGMFIASMMMMAFAWMMLGDRDDRVGAASLTESSQPAISEAERLELDALKKERDAALAVSRALERERDAALTAAKAQEQMRAAEVRAAEILAEQERKTEARLNEARARAREAEIAEAKARERERALQLRAQQRAAELEAQLEAERLEALRAEQARRELLAQQAALRAEQQRKQAAEQTASTLEPISVGEDNSPAETAQSGQTATQSAQQKQQDDKSSFSANPCNTPSAKFLSTCKR